MIYVNLHYPQHAYFYSLENVWTVMFIGFILYTTTTDLMLFPCYFFVYNFEKYTHWETDDAYQHCD